MELISLPGSLIEKQLQMCGPACKELLIYCSGFLIVLIYLSSQHSTYF